MAQIICQHYKIPEIYCHLIKANNTNFLPLPIQSVAPTEKFQSKILPYYFLLIQCQAEEMALGLRMESGILCLTAAAP